ncbi:hypothetical protein IMZ48_15465 [Candidatus Bathyarchaeota archaeon]|nr:hypothetical protein [Candidatus Bathyarchaeota archaeon]
MKLLALLAPLLAAAAPSLKPRGDESYFGNSCNKNIAINTNTPEDPVWALESYCKKGMAEPKKYTLALDTCIGNHDGGLVWRNEFVPPPQPNPTRLPSNGFVSPKDWGC